jgi:predicted DNA-binding transcriptional regulator YafY
MLLQTRGQMTAAALARELEVSERTIYRDVDALCAAGVPIYSEAGQAGGYGLLDNYRTTLTGLTEAEVRALFMLNIPGPLNALGVTDALRSALLKLTAALPATRRSEEARVRQRFYLDSTWWHQGAEVAPHLQTVHAGVWQDRKVQLTYRVGPVVITDQIVEPYGLVAKAGVWYLVCAANGRPRVHRVAELLDARLLDEAFAHPPAFDLATFWQAWCAEQEGHDTAYRVCVRVAPDFVPALPFFFGDSVRAQLPPADAPVAAPITVELAFASLEAARRQLLACGRGVEVLSPLALRKSIADFATQIAALYGE